MKPLRLDLQAEAELKASISRYEDERVGLGDEFWTEIQHALTTIADHPEVGGKVQRLRVGATVRRLPLRRFPYFVVYRDHPEFLEVLAFAHHSRRPGYWRTRGA